MSNTQNYIITLSYNDICHSQIILNKLWKCTKICYYISYYQLIKNQFSFTWIKDNKSKEIVTRYYLLVLDKQHNFDNFILKWNPMVFMNLFICENFIFCHFSWRKIIVLVYLDKQLDKFKLSMLRIF